MHRSTFLRIIFAVVALGACGDDDVAPPDAPPGFPDARLFDAMNPPDAMPSDAALTIAPNLQDFGSVPQGQDSSPVTFTVTNAGEGLSGAISAAITGSSDFSITANTCTSPLAADETCTIDVVFSPSALGNVSGTLTVSATPGGSASATLNGEGIMEGALSITPSPFNFGDTEVLDTSAPQTFTVENTGATATGTISAVLGGTNPTEFTIQTNNCTGTLAAGASCTIIVVFSPTSSGGKTASLIVSASPGGTVSAALSGNAQNPANITIAPTVQNFGSVAAPGGTSSDLTFTVTNTGDVATGNLTNSLGGTDASDFTIVTSTCNGLALAGGASCTITVHFNPATVGTKNATLTVMGTPGGSAVSSLTGVGVLPGQVSISPSPFNFGNQIVGTTSTAQTFTVTNTGATPTGTLATALSGVDSADFPIVSGGNGCQGVTLAAGATCTISVQFAPSSVGPKTATLTVAGTPGGSTQAPLSGTGIQPATIQVTPATQSFGSQPTGTMTAPVTFTVSNTGGAASGTPTVTLGGTDFAQFSIVSNGCTAPIPAGGSCQVTVRYQPTTVGSHLASLNVSATPGGSDSASLSGTGVTPAALVIVPSLANFGTVVQSGTSAPVSFAIRNTGSVATGTVSITLGGPNGAEWDIVTNTCTGALTASDPVADTDECAITLTYSPVTVGTHTGTVTASATPGGSAAATLNGTSTAGITIAPPNLAFGSWPLNRTSDPLTFTITNSTGTGAMSRTFSIAENFGSPAQFDVTATSCPAAGGTALAPGGTCTITVTFTPSGTAGPRTGNIVVTGTGGVTAQGDVSGTATEGLVIAPDPYNFGSVVVGNVTTNVFTVQNLSGAATGAVRTRISGTGFHVTEDNCAGTIRPAFPDAGCTITVMFQPQTATVHNGTLSVSATPGGTADSALTGTGTPPALLSITPGPTFSFADTRQTRSVMQTFVIANAAGAATTSTIDFTFTADAPFTSTLGSGGSCTDGQVLAGGGSCSITVTFAPTRNHDPGNYEATLSASAAQGGSPSVAIDGDVLSQLTITPDPGDFGEVILTQQSTPITFMITNAGLQSTASLTAATDDSQYQIVSGSNTCTILAAGATCQVDVQFGPENLGTQNATLTVQDVLVSADAGLTGVGIDLPDLFLDPFWNDFGSVIVGQNSAPRTIVLTNNGDSSAGPLVTTIDDAWGNVGFAFVTNGCSGATLVAGASCTMTVRFTPTAVDTHLEVLNVYDPVADTTVGAILIGEGRNASDLAINPTLHDFGAVALGGSSSSTTFTVVNNLASSVTLDSVGFDGSWWTGNTGEFTITGGTCMGGTVLTAGSSCTVAVAFTPVTPGQLDDRLVVCPTSGNCAVAAVNGDGTTAPDLIVSPTSFTYDDIAINTSQTQTFVVTNVGSSATGSVGVVLGGLDTPHFTLLNNNCAGALAAQDSCTFQVRFNPTTTGPKEAEVTVSDAADPTDDELIPLMGNALNPASLSISPSAPQNFGTVAVGAQTASTMFTVRNATGSADTGVITMSTGNSDFVITTDNCTGNTLAGNTTCTVFVAYHPTAVGADAGAIQAAATPGGTVSTALSGTGESALRFTAEPAFTSIAVGASQNRTFTVANGTAPPGGSPPPTTGNLIVTLDDANGQYAIISQDCVGQTLAAGADCDITVRFTPAQSGVQTGTLSVSATPGNSDSTTLAGSGL